MWLWPKSGSWLLLTEAGVAASFGGNAYLRGLIPSGTSRPSSPFFKRFLQAQLLYGFIVYVGLWLGHLLGLGSPFLDAWLTRTPSPLSPLLLVISAGLGIACALVTLALDLSLFTTARLQLKSAKIRMPALLVRLGALLHGAISEELLLRLFALTVVAAFIEVLCFGHLKIIATWSAIIVSSLLFAVGHLPATARVVPLSKPLVMRCLTLNGFGGLVFGTVYCSWGIECAIATHAGAGLAIQFIFPFLSQKSP